MIFSVVRDFAEALTAMPEAHPRRRIVALLDEAIRRDLHFIDRQPTTLFQCLWNTGWWFDAPDAGKHYANSRAPDAAGLHQWLEKCRNQREAETPGFPWLRSLRPPPLALGEGLKQVFRGHAGEIAAVACSPNGERLASAAWDATVHVWDAESGRQAVVLRGHQGPVLSVAYSPDGRRIATGSADTTVQLWDAETGAAVACLSGHRDGVTCVAYSRDGRRLLSGAGEEDKSFRVWNVDRAESIVVSLESAPTCLACSPDDGRVAVGADDGTLFLCDGDTGEIVGSYWEHQHGVTAVAFSPDGRQIATAGRDNHVRLWDADSGEVLAARRITAEPPLPKYGRDLPPPNHLTSLAYSRDGDRIVVGATDRTVRVWDSAMSQELAVLRGHLDEVTGVAFTPDGTRVISGSSDRTVRVWDAAPGGSAAAVRGHELKVTSLQFFFGGQLLASGSYDKTVRVWDVASGAETAVLSGHTGSVWHVAASPRGWRLVSASSDSTVRAWKPAMRTELGCYGNLGESGLAVAADGRLAASGSRQGSIRVWDVETGAVVIDLRGHAIEGRGESLFGEDPQRVTCLAFAPDGGRLASGSADTTARVWDLATGAELAVLRGPDRALTGIAFSPDGQRIAGATYDHGVYVWDASRGECLEVIHGTSDVTAVAGGPASFPWRIATDTHDFVIESTAERVAVAWFPDKLGVVTPHPSGRLWAAASDSRVYLFKLERA